MFSVDFTRNARTRNNRLAAIFGALIFYLLSFSGGAQVVFNSTTFYGPSSDPTVIVDGSGFGSTPVAVPVGSGLTGDDLANGQLFFNDDFTNSSTQPWQAGYPGNSLGLILSSYSSNQVIFSFGSALSSSNPAYYLNAGDPYRLSVNGATTNGTVHFSLSPVITSTTFEGPSTDPTVIIRGFNFGSAPDAVPVGQGLTGDDFVGGQFFFNDSTASWQAGVPSNSVGLNLLSYTPNEVTYTFGSALSGVNPAYYLTEGDHFEVAVNGATFDGTVAGIPEPSTGLLLVVGGILLMFVRRISTQRPPSPAKLSPR